MAQAGTIVADVARSAVYLRRGLDACCGAATMAGMPNPAIDRRIGYECLAFGKLFERNARFRGDHVGVIAPIDAGDARLTWRAFDRYANRLANALTKSGIGRGDRVSTLLGNSLALVGLYGACAKLGAAIVPMSPLLNASGVASLIRDAQPKAIVSTRSRAATLAKLAACLARRCRPSFSPMAIARTRTRCHPAHGSTAQRTTHRPSPSAPTT